MPRPVAEWIVRSLKGDQILFDAERDARRDYEARIAGNDKETAG
jgi:hypothetical protein